MHAWPSTCARARGKNPVCLERACCVEALVRCPPRLTPDDDDDLLTCSSSTTSHPHSLSESNLLFSHQPVSFATPRLSSSSPPACRTKTIQRTCKLIDASITASSTSSGPADSSLYTTYETYDTLGLLSLPAMPTLSLPTGLQLHYEFWRGGQQVQDLDPAKRTVVFLHAYGTNSSSWSVQMTDPRINQLYNFVTFDAKCECRPCRMLAIIALSCRGHPSDQRARSPH